MSVKQNGEFQAIVSGEDAIRFLGRVMDRYGVGRQDIVVGGRALDLLAFEGGVLLKGPAGGAGTSLEKYQSGQWKVTGFDSETWDAFVSLVGDV